MFIACSTDGNECVATPDTETPICDAGTCRGKYQCYNIQFLDGRVKRNTNFSFVFCLYSHTEMKELASTNKWTEEKCI